MNIQLFGFIINFSFLDLVLITGVGFLLVIFIFFRYSIIRKGQITRSLNMSLFLITLPHKAKDQDSGIQKNEKESISVMEQFLASLVSLREGPIKRFLYGPPYFAFEIATPVTSNEIFFYLACPRHFENLIEKQILSFYPMAQVEKTEDYNIFTPEGKTAAAYLKLAKKNILPIKTYQVLEEDPLSAITNALSKIPLGQGAAIQILIRAAGVNWRQEGEKIIKSIQAGRNLKKALINESIFIKAVNLSSQALKTKTSSPEIETQKKELTPQQEEAIKAISEKINKSAFEVNIRLIASAPRAERAEQVLSHLEGAFSQFNQPNFNEFKIYRSRFQKPRFLKEIIYSFIFRNFSRSRRIILNTEEVASIFHFPQKEIATPKLKRLRAKCAGPPANIPNRGLILGHNFYRGEDTIIRLAEDDRRRHLYVIGQTGTGKSVFFGELAKQDIVGGKGVCVIDPHGDLIEDILENIPRERADDVIVFDPSDTARPMGLNMLEYRNPEQKDFAVQEMIAIFIKLFPPEMIGPMFEHNMRNAMLTLMEDEENPGTIVEIPRIFSDRDFQKYKVSKVKDPIVRAFWEKEMAKTSDFHKSEMLGYLISKVGRFVENEMMRNIIGQSRSAFDFRDVMDKGKILLVNLSKGRTGEVNSSLLGLILVSKLQMAALSRGDIPKEERKDFYLYIDEFHNFTTDSIATILAEARKYKLNLSMAHQFIGQLPENIRDAVFGNVGSIVCFRIGADDAEFIAKEFDPVFNAQDLMNIDNYNAYVKLMINGTTSQPFNMATYPPTKGDSEMARKIKELSRFKYGRDKEQVEKEILERSRLGASAQAAPTFIPGEQNR